jgi:hypothetical protein
MKTLLVPGDRQEILERLDRLKVDAGRRWGKMSAHQMVCHLRDSFEVALGERHASPATGVFQRTVMKWGALYFPVPWPKGVPTRPEIDQAAGGSSPREFSRDAAGLRGAMDRFVHAGKWSPHPIFGEMKVEDWMRWGYLHMDHHLRQFGC